MTVNAPWLKSYGNVPHSLDYPDCSMAQLVFKAAEKYPNVIAYEFFGCKTNYLVFANEIRQCARGLIAVGIKKADRVTICMPNTPQAVIMFYALNLIGSVANMVHPLSAEDELVGYLKDSNSVAVLTLDQFASKLEAIIPRTKVGLLILSGVDDGLEGIKKPLYRLTKGRNIERRLSGGKVLRYSDLMIRGEEALPLPESCVQGDGDNVAAILYSGGT